MKIISALRKDASIRVLNGDKWLWFNKAMKEWVVCRSKKNSLFGEELISTKYEEVAMSVLMKQ